MAGNVNEWVYDVYRPLSYQDVSDLNPIRRNGYMDEAKNYDSKNNQSPYIPTPRLPIVLPVFAGYW